MNKLLHFLICKPEVGRFISIIVPFLALLSNIMTPRIYTDTQTRSDMKIVSHIIKFCTRANVHMQGSESYKAAQKVHNGLCRNILPDIIVAPESTEDVSRIVKISRHYATPISVRSGGHSYICNGIRHGKIKFLPNILVAHLIFQQLAPFHYRIA